MSSERVFPCLIASPFLSNEVSILCHAGVESGIGHDQVDYQGTGDACRDIPIKAAFHAVTLEPQGYVFGSSAKQSDSERIG